MQHGILLVSQLFVNDSQQSGGKGRPAGSAAMPFRGNPSLRHICSGGTRHSQAHTARVPIGRTKFKAWR